MALKEYNFAEVALIIGGNQIMGFADGEAITVERDEDDFKTYVGNDGETTRAKSNNRLGKITFKLAQSSGSNAFLTGLLKANSIVPTFVKDGSGSSIYASEQSYLLKPPNAAFAREVSEREYVLVCPDLQMAEGGN